jgi:hypothetical protein
MSSSLFCFFRSLALRIEICLLTGCRCLNSCHRQMSGSATAASLAPASATASLSTAAVSVQPSLPTSNTATASSAAPASTVDATAPAQATSTALVVYNPAFTNVFHLEARHFTLFKRQVSAAGVLSFRSLNQNLSKFVCVSADHTSSAIRQVHGSGLCGLGCCSSDGRLH